MLAVCVRSKRHASSQVEDTCDASIPPGPTGDVPTHHFKRDLLAEIKQKNRTDQIKLNQDKGFDCGCLQRPAKSRSQLRLNTYCKQFFFLLSLKSYAKMIRDGNATA
jgi:hypothetical protein